MKAKGLVLALGLGLAGCVAEVGGGLHHLAYYPSGLCQGVEVEVLGASPHGSGWRGTPRRRASPRSFPHGGASHPRGGPRRARVAVAGRPPAELSGRGGGAVPAHLPPLRAPLLTTPALPASGEVGLVVTEDPGSPSGLRVAVKR